MMLSAHKNKVANYSYPLTPPLPFVPSQEAAGVIIEVGENVDTRLIGKRVLGPTLFQSQSGGLADFCLMSARSVYEIPDAMSSEEAAGFFIPYQTAWVGLIPETLLNNVSLVGAMPTGFSPEYYADAHHDLIKHWSNGKLKVVGNQIFEFEDGLKAIEHIASGKVEGKVVVRIP